MYSGMSPPPARPALGRTPPGAYTGPLQTGRVPRPAVRWGRRTRSGDADARAMPAGARPDIPRHPTDLRRPGPAPRAARRPGRAGLRRADTHPARGDPAAARRARPAGPGRHG